MFKHYITGEECTCYFLLYSTSEKFGHKNLKYKRLVQSFALAVKDLNKEFNNIIVIKALIASAQDGVRGSFCFLFSTH